jgi:hypothetical protein
MTFPRQRIEADIHGGEAVFETFKPTVDTGKSRHDSTVLNHAGNNVHQNRE